MEGDGARPEEKDHSGGDEKQAGATGRGEDRPRGLHVRWWKSFLQNAIDRKSIHNGNASESRFVA